MPTQVGNADGDPNDPNSITVQVAQTQGIVLQLSKVGSRRDVVVGDVVTYVIAIRNTTGTDVQPVTLQDTPPPGLSYLAGTALFSSRGIRRAR